MSGDEHEQAHQRHCRPMNDSSDGQPYKKIASKALYRPCHVDHPRSTKTEEIRNGRGLMAVSAAAAAMDGDGGVEEAGEDTGVGSDVFEHGDGIERCLVVTLARFENR